MTRARIRTECRLEVSRGHDMYKGMLQQVQKCAVSQYL